MMKILVDKTKKTILVIILIISIGLLIACKPVDIEEPSGEDKMDLIKNINLITESPIAYHKVEFSLDSTNLLDELEFNPYDYREINIKARFISPSDEQLVIPAFWYQDYQIFLNTAWTQNPTGISGRASMNSDEPQGYETVTLTGDPHYRVRYLPKESGIHQMFIEVTKDNVIVQSMSKTFEVGHSDEIYRGVIKVEPVHNRNFIFEDGTTFIPIGQNVAWYTSSTRQTEDYAVWFEKMQENYANFARVWMAPWGFSLHWGVNHDNFDTRLNQAARMDKMFELAEAHDIYFMLALLNHGQFSANVNPQWNLNPWNKINGGPLDYPSQFFTNKEAKETYKQQLLYILGRYGYSSKVMAWELFNEVDWTDNFNSTTVYIWHTEMSQFIKENDAYNRMVTTSYKGYTGGAYQSKWIDFINPHNYDYESRNFMTHLTPIIDNLFRNYQKPVLQSEIGVNWENGTLTTQKDPTGISLKQAQWTGMMGGGAGGAMNWWWDSWVHPNDLYYRFVGAGKFSKNLDMTGSSYELLQSLPDVNSSHTQVNIIGYKIDDRVYGYAYDKNWRHDNTNINQKNSSFTIPIDDGIYRLDIYDTDTGDIIETRYITSIGGLVTFDLTMVEDIAFIIKET